MNAPRPEPPLVFNRGGAAVTDDPIVQCLMDVRRALEPEQEVIRTTRGMGYRCDAGVRPADAGAEADPRCEPVRAELASVLTPFAIFGLEPPSVVLPAAEVEARRAVEGHSRGIEFAAVDPILDPLRHEPRSAAQVRPLGFPATR